MTLVNVITRGRLPPDGTFHFQHTLLRIYADLTNITEDVHRHSNTQVPDKLKITKVIPIFNRLEVWNYRPMSLLSVFDKLL